MGRLEQEPSAVLGWYRGTAELVEQGATDFGGIDALDNDVRLRWAVCVVHVGEAQRDSIPGCSVGDTYRLDATVLAAEPARPQQGLDKLTFSGHQGRGISTRKMCAGWTCGSSRTQFQLPRQVYRSSESRSCIT